MLPDRVSNPGPLTYESGALPIALRGPAFNCRLLCNCLCIMCVVYSPLLGGNKGSIHLLQLFIFLLWYFLCMYSLNFM